MAKISGSYSSRYLFTANDGGPAPLGLARPFFRSTHSGHIDRPPAATRANSSVWSKPACTSDLSERAVYAHRLITARNYSGCGLGAELIDWAGLRARREYGARWIRIDVWTSNKALHDYYRKRGFMSCGSCADPAYPSGVLFQKPSAGLRTRRIPQFSGSAANFDMAGLRAPVLSG